MPLLQPEHSCTQGEAGMEGQREISLLQRDHFVSPFQIPAAPALTPCLAFPSPPEPSTRLYTTMGWKQLPDFPGIFKTDKNVNLLSYPKGINSGTRRGSTTVAHVRSRRKISLQNKKSQNKNRKENNFQRFPRVNCSNIKKKQPSRENKCEQNPSKFPGEEKSLCIEFQIFLSMVAWFSIPTLDFIYASTAQVKIFKHKVPEFNTRQYLNSL